SHTALVVPVLHVIVFFFQAEDGIRDATVTEFRRVLFRSPGVNSAVLAIAIVYTPIFARVMRGPVLAERAKDYVEAVRALGATRLAVALKHILPNVISPFVVQGTVALSQAILIEASLSYLGLSAP